MTDEQLERRADRLVRVSRIRAVLLGGSRARGDHDPDFLVASARKTVTQADPRDRGDFAAERLVDAPRTACAR